MILKGRFALLAAVLIRIPHQHKVCYLSVCLDAAALTIGFQICIIDLVLDL